MTSNQHGPYVRGDTRVTMGGTEGSYPATGCESPKAALSSDRSLQPDSLREAGFASNRASAMAR